MAERELIEVQTKAQEKEFLKVNVSINGDNPNYIRPLDKDVLDVFDPAKNKTFRFGKTKRWLLKEGDNYIGRIAAFTNKKNVQPRYIQERRQRLHSKIPKRKCIWIAY